jgi:voltage-gated potassium channel
MASRGTRRLFERLGRVALVAVGVTVVGSLVAYYAEHTTNPEFATVGDSLWWGIVTLTTVGYGDIVPKTPTGRWAGVTIMVTGIAVLGLLSGSLASFFRLGDGDDKDGGADTEVEPGNREVALTALTQEVSALRRQVEALTERLTAQGGPPRPDG